MKRMKLLLCAMLFMSISACGSSTEINLKEDLKEGFNMELGDNFKAEASLYVDGDKGVLENSVVEINLEELENITVSRDKEDRIQDVLNLPVGEHNATVTYEKEVVDFKVIVKDTTAPVFKDFKEEIKVDRDYKGDLSKKFTAEDLSDVKLSVEDKDVDYSKAGTYSAQVTAIDKYDNKTTKEFTVVVEERSKAEKETEEKKQATEQNVQQSNQQNQNTQGSAETGGSSSGGSAGTDGSGVCSFISWQMISNSGYANHDYQTAWNWGMEQMNGENFTYTGFKVFTTKDNCGNTGYTVSFY